MSELCVDKGVFKGGGFRGFKPPPPQNFSDFFLKSKGRDRKKKRDVEGEGGGATS